jgi:hypothetical protein
MIVETLGLEASASTWLFNVCREIIKLKYDRSYSVTTSNLIGLQKQFVLDGKLIHELPSPRMEQPDCIVIKSHSLEAELYWFLRASGARFILSVRDPRDAMASMMERLGENEQAWAANLVRSLSSVMTSRHGSTCLIYSYETRFFDSPETLEGLAAFLEAPASRDELMRCFERFTRGNVQKIVSSVGELGADRLLKDHAGRLGDYDTQFNASHIGDGRSGKWTEVVHPSLRPIVDRCFRDVAGKTSLEDGYTMRFHEALFTPVKMPYGTPYEPIFLMRYCWLPRGRWRMKLSGGFPNGKRLQIWCDANSQRLFHSAIEDSSSDYFVFEFEADISYFDKAVNVFASGEGFSTLDPLREHAIVLEATFMRHLP